MIRLQLLGTLLLVFGASVLPAQQPFTPVVQDVNKRLVKLFGAGGFKGLPDYGTGILISAKGHILTVNNHILANQELMKVHLYDGRQFNIRILAREPELDIALLKIDDDVDFLPHFDLAETVKKPIAEPGTWILAFSNTFKIATRDEPMSVQRGVITAYTDLRGRRGIFDAPFHGEAYFLDCIANNPGAAGGVVTNRKGELLGIIGRELKNTLTDTWINYAVPIQATVDITRQDQPTKVNIMSFIKDGMSGVYQQSDERKRKEDKGGFHGIILVANAVSSTPPYVEDVVPDSPAAKAGLRPDDLIVYVEGEQVPNIKSFREALRNHGPGDEIKLDMQRANRLVSAKLKLTEQPRLKK